MTLPVPAPRTWSVNDLVSAALLNTNIRDAVNYLAARPLFRGHASATQSLANNTWTQIGLDTNDVDTYTGHSTVTNNARYVGKAAGYYWCFGITNHGPNVSGDRYSSVTLNGTTPGGAQSGAAPSPNASHQTSFPFGDVLFMNGTTDYASLWGYQSSGGALATAAGSFLICLWVHS